MGISASGIVSICNLLELEDPAECLLKVKELVSEIRRLEGKKEKEPKGNIDGKHW